MGEWRWELESGDAARREDKMRNVRWVDGRLLVGDVATDQHGADGKQLDMDETLASRGAPSPDSPKKPPRPSVPVHAGPQSPHPT